MDYSLNKTQIKLKVNFYSGTNAHSKNWRVETTTFQRIAYSYTKPIFKMDIDPDGPTEFYLRIPDNGLTVTTKGQLNALLGIHGYKIRTIKGEVYLCNDSVKTLIKQGKWIELPSM